MKRRLLIIALGVAFLIAITSLGTFVTSYIPQRDTPQIQTVQAGMYSVELRIDPNPPSIERMTRLSIQVLQTSSHQPLNEAHLVIDGTMVSMDMGAVEVVAKGLGQGNYVAQMPFSMSGLWQLQLLVSAPGQPVVNAAFSVQTQ